MPDDKQNDDESTEVEATDDPSANEKESIETEIDADADSADDSAETEPSSSAVGAENDEAEEGEEAEEIEEPAAVFDDDPAAEEAAESEEGEVGEGDEGDESAETSEPPAKAADEVYCSSCGAAIKKDAEVCPECGVRQQGGGEEKNPGIAAIASFFIPGLGDLYNGEFGRGGIVFLIWIVGAFVWGLLVTVLGVITLGLGLLLLPLYAIANVVSAYLSYKRAEKINAGEITV